jgi:hypothetical protein
MRARASILAAALAGSSLATTTSTARADELDPSLERFVLTTRCQTTVGGAGNYYNPAAGFRSCLPDDLSFAKLVAQMGAALAPIPQYASRTTGFGGYKVSIQGAYTTIDKNAPYWKKGTQGPIDKSSNQSSVINNSPPSVLQMYSARIAKGLPFGFEVGATFGWLANSGIVAGGGDIRASVLEGFRPYLPLGYLPDVAVGGGVRTITGTSQIKLTIASFDAGLSKPIPIAGTVVLQPHVGYQWLRIFGDSGLIDMTPNTEAVGHCGYSGDNTPASPDPAKITKSGPTLDGQPVCRGSSADFNNNVVFNNIRLTRHRINFGFDFRFQMVYFGVNVLTDLVPVAKANTGTVETPDKNDPSGQKKLTVNPFEQNPNSNDPDAVKSQWTVAVELGAAF